MWALALLIPYVRKSGGSGRDLLQAGMIPEAAVFVLFLTLSPLSRASSGDFYAGADTLAQSLRSLYDVSLAHGCAMRPFLPFCATPWRSGSLC
jgi:hypothetical protein